MTALPRRRVLALLALPPLLTACGAGSSGTSGAAASASPVDPDTRARSAVTALLRPLLGSYDALTPPQPRLAATALTQLQALTEPTASTSASPSATAPSSAARRLQAGAVARQELALARLCSTELLRTSPSLARLLASVAAGATLRAVALGSAVRPDDHVLSTAPAASSIPLSDTSGDTESHGRAKGRDQGNGRGHRALGTTAGTVVTAAFLTAATPAPSSAGTPGLDALQGALAAEHAAVYGYGVLGAQLSGKARTQAQTDYDLHRGLRDALVARIAAAGGTPVAAAPGYRLPYPVTDAASARRLAVTLEDRLAAVRADGVRAATGAQRGEAAGQLLQAALRAQSWGGAVTAFPGLPERAASATR